MYVGVSSQLWKKVLVAKKGLCKDLEEAVLELELEGLIGFSQVQ